MPFVHSRRLSRTPPSPGAESGKPARGPGRGVLLLVVASLVACSHPDYLEHHHIAVPEPVAAKRPHRIEAHGEVRIDDYYWLRERDNPDVVAYLEAENRYADAVLYPSLPFRNSATAAAFSSCWR